jgi:metallo-beta-lactamase class B
MIARRRALISATLSVALLSACAAGQSSGGSVDAHLAAAKAAARNDQTVWLDLCDEPDPEPTPTPQQVEAAAPQAPPARSEWHAEPVKVFDNLYFVGQTEYSAWAVTTSAGIIIVDTIFDYSVEDEVVGGLERMGLDPRTIKSS